MFLYEARGEYFAQVAGGLEDMAAAELRALGAAETRTFARGIDFRCDREALYRINYRARLLSRVLAPLTRFDVRSGEDLYLKTKKIDWTHLFTLEQTFGVAANVSRSVIDNSHFAALKVKDVVVDMFRKRYRGKRPNVDTREPDLWINLHIRNDTATVSLDCSGGPLHRRGYRLQAVAAPMQETLAAAILDFAEWEGKQPLYDPMCGSGTLLSEAWLKASRLPAGCLRRKFGFMMLPDYDRTTWVKVKDPRTPGLWSPCGPWRRMVASTSVWFPKTDARNWSASMRKPGIASGRASTRAPWPAIPYWAAIGCLLCATRTGRASPWTSWRSRRSTLAPE